MVECCPLSASVLPVGTPTHRVSRSTRRSTLSQVSLRLDFGVQVRVSRHHFHQTTSSYPLNPLAAPFSDLNSLNNSFLASLDESLALEVSTVGSTGPLLTCIHSYYKVCQDALSSPSPNQGYTSELVAPVTALLELSIDLATLSAKWVDHVWPVYSQHIAPLIFPQPTPLPPPEHSHSPSAGPLPALVRSMLQQLPWDTASFHYQDMTAFVQVTHNHTPYPYPYPYPFHPAPSMCPVCKDSK